MKTCILCLISICLCSNLIGQVSGKLTTTTGQPIPFANVLLLTSADSSLVKATLTSDSGLYRLETTAPGLYRLRVSSVGYQTWHSPVFERTTDQTLTHLGTQVLLADANQIAEVVVRAEKPLFQQTVEGTIVHVGSSILSKGSSALQLLERSPGVMIDYRNSSIGLNGKSGVTVLLNGKQLRMPAEQVVALLNGMSANDLETIELLTTPGARYDAEGSAGLINIVTKKARHQGTTGSFSLTGGYGRGEKAISSINLAHNAQRINIYGSYAFLRDRSYSDLAITSSQVMPVLGGELAVVVQNTSQAKQTNHDATVGIDLKLGTKTTIGGSLALNSSVRVSTDYNRLNYTILPDSLLLFRGTINGINRWKNRIGSLYAERKWQQGDQIDQINGAIDYIYFTNTNPTEVQSTFLTENSTQAGNNDSLFAPRQRGFAKTAIRVGVAKVDYLRQWSPKLRLEVGLKGTYTRNVSGAGIESLIDNDWVSRTETVNDIVMTERIGAVYASIHAQLNPATNVIIGTRYEYAHTRLDNRESRATVVNRKLSVLFPTISLSRKLSENAEIQVSYTKRISRPSYNDLASFVQYSDPSAVYTGNPLLKPTITSNLKVGYTYRGYSCSVLLSRDDWPIARYQITESPARNLLYVTPQNLVWQNNLNLQISLPWKATDWWTMVYGFTGGLRQFKAEHTLRPVQKTYFGYSVTVDQTFRLPRSFSAELSSWYNSVSYNGTIKVGTMGALNAGLKKDLKNNRGSLQLSATDVLQTMRISSYYGTLTKEAFSAKNHVIYSAESSRFPIVKLTYSRSFGNSQSSKYRTQTNSSNDEQSRVRKE